MHSMSFWSCPESPQLTSFSVHSDAGRLWGLSLEELIFIFSESRQIKAFKMSHFQSTLGVLSSPSLSLSPAFLKCFQKEKKKNKKPAILGLKQPLQLQPRLQVAHCFGRSAIHKDFFSQGKSQIYPGVLLNRK